MAARECRRAPCTSMSSNDSDIVPGPSPVAPAPISSASGLSLYTIAPSNIREKQPVKLRENRHTHTIRWGGPRLNLRNMAHRNQPFEHG